MHLTDGTLRRSVDDEYAIDTSQRRHLDACRRCRARLEAVDVDAKRAAALLASTALAVDRSRAWQRVNATLGGVEQRALPNRRAGRLRAYLVLRRRTVRSWSIGVAAALALSGALIGTGAAQQFLTVFQPRQFSAVPVSAADIRSLAGLADYGTISGSPSLSIEPASSAAVAQAGAGLAPPVVDQLPAGVVATLRYAVIPGGTVAFTFNAAKAEAAASRRGATLPAMPAGIDGTTLSVTLFPAVVVSYGLDISALLDTGTVPRGHSTLVVVASRIPSVTSTGATVQQLESYLLAQPGIPDDVAAEVRAIGDPTTTLPVPIPVGLASAQQVTVGSAHGLVIGDSTGVGSIVIWQNNGIVYAVAGSLSQAQVLEVARSLR